MYASLVGGGNVEGGAEQGAAAASSLPHPHPRPHYRSLDATTSSSVDLADVQYSRGLVLQELASKTPQSSRDHRLYLEQVWIGGVHAL